MLPFGTLCGTAGAGKDTVAGILKEEFGAQPIAFADRLKQFGYHVMGFTEEQLWGPSSSRNAVDPRFSPGGLGDAWDALFDSVDDLGGSRSRLQWTRRWISDLGLEIRYREAFSRLRSWARSLVPYAAQGGLSPRVVLQTLGTEWGREMDPRLWITNGFLTASRLHDGGYRYDRINGLVADPTRGPVPFVAITDGRFPNEGIETLRHGGSLILVEDPTTEGTQAAQKAGVQGHASELQLNAIPRAWYSAIIHNNKSRGLEALRQSVRDVYARLHSPYLVGF